MHSKKILLIFLILKFVDAQFQKSKVHLEKISSLYIPSRYDSNDFPKFKLGKHAAEQLAYDPVQKLLYVTGEERLSVVDLSNPDDPRIVYRKQFDKMDPTDVEYCGNHVFVTVNNDDNPEEGRVMVFRTYNKRHNTMPIVLNIVAGPSPNSLLPTSNCQTILVALEGDPFARGGNLIDPEGGIGVLKFPSNFISENTYNYKILDFGKFNKKYSLLARSGVRFVYKENGNTFAQDLEPEQITLSADEKKAYVTLQENNAIAEVDLVTDSITQIHGLGFKDWKKYKLDPSDSDGGINMYSYPVYGIYQPNAIKTVTVGRREFLVTADEGDSKDYSGKKLTTPGFNEVKRVKDIVLSDKSEVLQWANQRKIPNIQNDALLGKLQITIENGRLKDGTFDKLYTFGGRGFSVLRSDSMNRVFDSGSSVEESHALQFPKLFNSYVKSSANITDTFDTRSDNKGPESESLEVAYDGPRAIVFVGNERPGSISIYSFNNDMSGGTLESIYSGIWTLNGTWGEAFSQGYISDLDPENIKYLSPNHSPNGQPMLLVAGSESGTVSLFNVKGMRSPLPNPQVNYRVQVKPLRSEPLKETSTTEIAATKTISNNGAKGNKQITKKRNKSNRKQRRNIQRKTKRNVKRNNKNSPNKRGRKLSRKTKTKGKFSRKTKTTAKKKKSKKTKSRQKSKTKTSKRKKSSKSKKQKRSSKSKGKKRSSKKSKSKV
ncbi:uncharacterized protein LOC133206198 isoform X1 [Saccostrea echinata]|uniref:uncharacterized protein LOC133206198 isoform X1 n=1 Tax=Saccostrea echinata TaxID=191078 RepID=UPI002A83E805|nr:uncharacterized protein LOC133206198 isoform X1 [Saccostrea echinata]